VEVQVEVGQVREVVFRLLRRRPVRHRVIVGLQLYRRH
jgi:hypothetical protein